MTLPNHGPRPGQKDDISLVKYKSVIKLFVAATVGCQGTKNRVFASFCAGIHRKHPTHALQHTAGTTPPSGTPCEFTGRVWEVACCSGKPKWAQDTAKTEVSSRNGTWTQLGGTSVGRGAPSWFMSLGKLTHVQRRPPAQRRARPVGGGHIPRRSCAGAPARTKIMYQPHQELGCFSSGTEIPRAHCTVF